MPRLLFNSQSSTTSTGVREHLLLAFYPCLTSTDASDELFSTILHQGKMKSSIRKEKSADVAAFVAKSLNSSVTLPVYDTLFVFIRFPINIF